MWPRQTFRWLFLISLLWSHLALGRWLLHQSQVLFDDIDPWAIVAINVLVGVFAGTWLILSQRLLFAAQPFVERVYWFAIAILGLWVVAPDSNELHRLLELWYERFVFRSGRLGGSDGAGVPFWQWGMIVPLSLWMAHPLFRGLRIDSAKRGETTVPFLRGVQSKQGLVRHPWFVRSLVVIGLWLWLKSGLDLRQIPSEAYGLTAIVGAGIGVGAVLATIPYYLAITLQRRLLGFLVFHVPWLTIAGLAVAAPYLWGISIGFRPNSLLPALLLELSACLVGFATTMVISFWCSCLYRDRASLLKTTSDGAEERSLQTTNATEPPGTNPPNSSPYRWSQYLVIACAAGALLGVTHWGALFGQQNLHVFLWMMTDSNHWGRATSLARLQSLQAFEPDVAKNFRQRRWQSDQPLIATFNGTVQCVVTARMGNDPRWSPLRDDVERDFKDVFWSMEFPVSDPDDVRGSAYSSLKIDGQRLPLRNLPSIVYSTDWHVYGGTVEAADFARGVGPFRLSFYGCEFTDVDFQTQPVVQFQSLLFSDCTFLHRPRSFPSNIRAEYRLSRPEEFLEQHEILIESLYNDVVVTLAPAEPAVFDARDLLTKLPEQWRNLVSIRPASPVLRLELVSMGQLLSRSGNLPPNFRTRGLETDKAGRIIGIDFQIALLDNNEAVANELLADGLPLEWISFKLGRVSVAHDIQNLVSLLERSWLLEINGSHTATAEIWSPSLTKLDSAEVGFKAFYISGTLAPLTSDLLAVVPNREVLVVDCQTWPAGFLAAVAGMPNLKHLIVLTAGDTPDLIEAAGLKVLQGLKGRKVIAQRRPSSTSELVPVLRQLLADLAEMQPSAPDIK